MRGVFVHLLYLHRMAFSNTIVFMFKNKDTQKFIGAIVVLLLAGVFVWYITKDLSSVTPKESGNVVKEASTSPSIKLVKNGNIKIKKIPVNTNFDANTLARPKLNRVIVIPKRFPPEAVKILQNNITKLTTELKKNPDSFSDWSDLAKQYYIIDDFKGAVEIWKYLTVVAKGDTVSLVNLGKVYFYQLKDYKKSETAFKKAISINSKLTEAYVGLHNLYRYSYKTDTTLAIDILKEGIKSTNSTDLQMLLASYYTKLGMKDKAEEVYKEVLVVANTSGNTNLVTIVKAAINSLK